MTSDIEVESSVAPKDVAMEESVTTDSSDDFSSETFLDKTCKSVKHVCPFLGCTMMFSKPWRLETHKRIHTGEKPYACKEPGCSKAYTRLSHLKRHVANSHAKKDDVKSVKNGDDSSDDDDEKDDTKKSLQSFPCKSCPKQFQSKYSLNKHERVAHSGNAKRYPCTTCGQTFAKKTWLNSHIASHNKELPHKCTKCGKSFAIFNKLERHMLSHEHKCPNCDLICNSFTELRKHKAQAHVSKDKKTCPICQVEFNNRSRLRQHYVTHSDTRDVYKCSYPMCPRSYLHERNLKQHVEAYHKNNRFACSFEGCEAKLATRGKLVSHMKTMHENLKRPTKPKKTPKSHKKNPKKPMAALLTGAVLPRELEREIIVEGRTFELSLPELSQEVGALKSDSEAEAPILEVESPLKGPACEPETEESVQKKSDEIRGPSPAESPQPQFFLLPVRQLKINGL